jgi:hypothetical protein
LLCSAVCRALESSVESSSPSPLVSSLLNAAARLVSLLLDDAAAPEEPPSACSNSARLSSPFPSVSRLEITLPATSETEGWLACSEISEDRTSDENWLEGAPLAAGCAAVVDVVPLPEEIAELLGTSCPAKGSALDREDDCAPMRACI